MDLSSNPITVRPTTVPWNAIRAINRPSSEVDDPTNRPFPCSVTLRERPRGFIGVNATVCGPKRHITCNTFPGWGDRIPGDG